jgi:hypothetical protein
LKRFKRFLFALQSIRGNSDVVLKLAAPAQPVRVSEVHERALVVGALERGASALEVLPTGSVIGRLLCRRRRRHDHGKRSETNAGPTKGVPPAPSHTFKVEGQRSPRQARNRTNFQVIPGAYDAFQLRAEAARLYERPTFGVVAQLGERRVRNAEVRGSIPLSSTIFQGLPEAQQHAGSGSCAAVSDG